MLNITRWSSHPWNWLHALGLYSPHWMRMKQSAKQAQTRRIHQAFHCAYGRFAQAYPTWVARRFDAQFLRQTTLKRLMRGRRAEDFTRSAVTALSLALAWDSQFGALAPDEAVRSCQVAELIVVANCFLALLETELTQLAATPANPQGSLA